jgi:hypothetical protein
MFCSSQLGHGVGFSSSPFSTLEASIHELYWPCKNCASLWLCLQVVLAYLEGCRLTSSSPLDGCFTQEPAIIMPKAPSWMPISTRTDVLQILKRLTSLPGTVHTSGLGLGVLLPGQAQQRPSLEGARIFLISFQPLPVIA